MPEYGYYKGRRKPAGKKSSGGSAAMKVIDLIILIGSIVCSIFLVMALMASYIDPNKIWFIAFFGIMFPVLYAIEAFFALYWIVRWKKYVFGILVVLLVCVSKAGLFYRLDLRKHYDENTPLKSELVVMSYNIMYFNEIYGTPKKPTVELIADFVTENNVDVLCMQEFKASGGEKGEFEIMLPALKHIKYNSFVGGFTERNPGETGLAIYSRYPIIDGGVAMEDAEGIRSIWADVRIKRDTVRVVNSHLQSTYVKDNDIDFLSSLRFISDDDSKEKLGVIIDKMSDNYKRRAPQADGIGAFIEESPYPVIACGDFNDTPVSYAYNKIRGSMQDAFVEKGRGTNGTYNGFFNMFRIDYILASRDIQILNYYPFDVVYSDHNPVAASFDFLK